MAERATTVAGMIADLRAALQDAGIADAAFDARALVGGLLGYSSTELLTKADQAVSDDDAQRMQAALARRLTGESVHRILGYRDFYGLRLTLSAETLEPRPDTEILVDTVLPALREIVAGKGRGGATGEASIRILDLGTGTGAICLALLSECAQAMGVGVDISNGALAVARRNAELNGLGSRFSTLESDWFSAVTGRFDVIVSNPPYIPSAEISGLSREVRDFDPLRALDGGMDGLAPYRIIARDAARHLAEDGIVAIEIGWNQKAEIGAIFEQAGFEMLDSVKDYGGNNRVMVFRPGARLAAENLTDK